MNGLQRAFERLLSRHHAGTDEVLGFRGRVAMATVLVLLVVLAPVINAVEAFWLDVISRILIFALFAISLDLVFGYTGLPSFGHAAMFGVGGYTVALLNLGPTTNLVVTMGAAAIAAAVVAFVIGWFSVRGKGLFFAFLTLAFAQPLYIAAFNDLPARILSVETITNGDDGLIGVPSFTLFGFDFGGLLPYYYLTLVLFVISVALIIRIANSEFGRVLQGIRENENRMAALGYDVTRYKIIGFTISGLFAGIAGALYVPLVSVAHPNLLFWVTSADGVIMVLIGGSGTLWGPMLGATFVLLFEEFLSVFGNWHLYLGLVYVVMVIFLPKGIAGGLLSLLAAPNEAFGNVRQAGYRYVRKVKGYRRL